MKKTNKLAYTRARNEKKNQRKILKTMKTIEEKNQIKCEQIL